MVSPVYAHLNLPDKSHITITSTQNTLFNLNVTAICVEAVLYDLSQMFRSVYGQYFGDGQKNADDPEKVAVGQITKRQRVRLPITKKKQQSISF